MIMRQFTAILLISICLPVASEFIASESACVRGQDFIKVKQDNWHQWRGPDATGVASTGNPPIRWNDQSNIRWKFPIVGEGSSTPIIWKNQVFILSAVETNRRGSRSAPLHPEAKTVPSNQIFEFVVWSLDRRNGDVLWKRVVTESVPLRRPTPLHDLRGRIPHNGWKTSVCLFRFIRHFLPQLTRGFDLEKRSRANAHQARMGRGCLSRLSRWQACNHVGSGGSV